MQKTVSSSYTYKFWDDLGLIHYGSLREEFDKRETHRQRDRETKKQRRNEYDEKDTGICIWDSKI